MKKRLRGLLGLILTVCLLMQPVLAYAATGEILNGFVNYEKLYTGGFELVQMNDPFDTISIQGDSGGAFKVTNAGDITAYSNVDSLSYDQAGVVSAADTTETGNAYTKSALQITSCPEGYKGIMVTSAELAGDYYYDSSAGGYYHPLLLTFAFNPITYTTYFNGRGGVAADNQSEVSVPCKYGVDAAIPSFSKEGFTLTGFEAVEGGTALGSSGSFKNLTTTDGASLNYEAVWGEIAGNLYIKDSGFNYGADTVYPAGTKLYCGVDGYFNVSIDGVDHTADINGAAAVSEAGAVNCKNGSFTLPALADQDAGYKITAAQTSVPVYSELTESGRYWNVEISTVKKSYTLAFNGNGGDGSMESLEKTAGTDFALPANAFSREGYRFEGWSVDGSSTVSYTDGGRMSFTPQNNGDTLTLYAVWAAVGPFSVANGTVHLDAGVNYSYGGGTGFHVSGDTTLYPSGLGFYVSSSGDYTFTSAE